MRTQRDIYWHDSKVMEVKLQTTGTFHTVLTQDELELVLGIATDEATSAVRTILDAKGHDESTTRPQRLNGQSVS